MTSSPIYHHIQPPPFLTTTIFLKIQIEKTKNEKTETNNILSILEYTAITTLPLALPLALALPLPLPLHIVCLSL